MAEPQLSPPLNRRDRHTNKKRKGIWRFLLISALILICTIIGIGVYFLNKIDDGLDKISQGSPSDQQEMPVEEQADVKHKNILILGLDSRPETGSLNTDVIMVASLDPSGKSGILVSIPRDTYIDPTGWKPNKANSFFAAANRLDASSKYTEVKAIFGEFLGVPIDYVLEVNFTAFQEIIDQFNGITIDVDMNMRYVDPTDGTNINLDKGIQTVTGKEALDFVRYRHSNDGSNPSSDFDRNQRQQQVISKLVEKIKSPEIILRAGGVIDAIGNNVKSDIPKFELYNLIRTYAGIGNDNIEYIHLGGVWKSPYVWIDEEQLQQAKQTLQAHMEVQH